MAKELCQNRTYETKPISQLPHAYHFVDGSKSLVVNYATTDQLGHCRKMIEEAALRGDNVGVDEYADGSDAIESLFVMSEIFHAFDPVSGKIEAFMLIQPCLYQRCKDSCTASVYVFRTKDIDDKVHAELMSLVADFAKAIDIGYTQCFTQVALCLHGLYLQLRRRGFLTVAVLPNWVSIAGSSLRDNALMVKDFGMAERPVRSQIEVLKMVESLLSKDVLDKDTSINFRQIPGLPKSFLLENGTKLVLRNAKENEDQLLYETLTDAVEKGQGYSEHEFHSLQVMRIDHLANGYIATIEEENTNKLMGFLFFRDAVMFRGGKGKILEGSAVITAGVRGKGFGNVFQSMGHFVMSLLGYKRILRDTFHTNSQTLKLWQHEGVSVCGVLPRGAFQKGVGWVDLILCEHDNKSNGPLPETTKCRL